MRYRTRFRKLVYLFVLIFGVEFVIYCNIISDYFFPENILSNTDITSYNDSFEQSVPENFTTLNVKTHKLNLTIRDGLSIYTWRGLCTDQLNHLKAFPGFPLYPDIESSTNSLNIQLDDESFGLRIFGYIIPDTFGNYQFKIDVINSEIWLATDFDPKNMKIIAKADTPSDLITFQANEPYYIEIITASSINIAALSVSWRTPNGDDYEEITQLFLAHFPSNELDYLQNLPAHETQFQQNMLNDPREKFPLLNPLPSEMYPTIPNCSQDTDRLTPNEIVAMHGVWHVHETEIILSPNSDQHPFYEAPAMNNEEVINILQSFNSFIGNNSEKIKDFIPINLEKSYSEVREDQYLLEGIVKMDKLPNKTFLLSQNIHVENGKVCIPKITGNLTAFVHIVIIIKDQRRWISCFLENVNKIYEQTNDKQFGVIIVDFNSKDLRVDQLMKHTLKLKHYKYIPMDGAFNKVRGQNMAISSVLNPNEIIFTCDLQLNIPINMIDSIRKHTTQGISVYTPLLRRLNCGVITFDGPGMWEVIGYGLVSMFKTDWEAIGGMSVEFGEKWGGEDWDLVDRVLRIGYHIHRLRMPALVHYYHLRDGAWYIGA